KVVLIQFFLVIQVFVIQVFVLIQVFFVKSVVVVHGGFSCCRVCCSAGLRRFEVAGTHVLLIFQPGDVGRVVGEALDAGGPDRLAGHHRQGGVARVVRLAVGVVAGSVVAADHRPARLVGAVLVRAV